MARADLILTLIKASRQGEDIQLRKAVEALAADEGAKNNTILADRLLVQLQSGSGRHVRQTPLLSRSAVGRLVTETARSLSDLILSAAAAEAVTSGSLKCSSTPAPATVCCSSMRVISRVSCHYPSPLCLSEIESKCLQML